jgi:hypothetical protein
LLLTMWQQSNFARVIYFQTMWILTLLTSMMCFMPSNLWWIPPMRSSSRGG